MFSDFTVQQHCLDRCSDVCALYELLTEFSFAVLCCSTVCRTDLPWLMLNDEGSWWVMICHSEKKLKLKLEMIMYHLAAAAVFAKFCSALFSIRKRGSCSTQFCW